MKYIDIHCHLDFPDYDQDREEVLGRMKEKEVGAIIIGTDPESSKRAVEIADQNENIWASIGIHPGALSLGEGWEGSFEKLVQNPKVMAIGECGLDYFVRRSFGEGGLSEKEKNLQKKLFEQQIELAIKHDKPLMLHIRPSKNSGDAYCDALNILENYKKNLPTGEENKLRGNAHFFAGDLNILKRFLNIAFSVSFTGVITFSNDYDEFIKYSPINKIMAETDAPFVSPIPYRGKRNSPLYVIEVVKKIAEIRGEDFEYVRQNILLNAINLFNLKI